MSLGLPVVRAFAASLLAVSLAAQGGAPIHVVMISVDGLMPSSYTTPDLEHAPTLSAMAKAGAYADGVIGVLPTVTYASHTALITGVPPAVHGIYGNEILDPERRSNGAWYWYANEIRVPTLIEAARARAMTTSAISWPVSVGMRGDYVVPEFWRSGSSHPADYGLIRALSSPGLLDAFEQARGGSRPWPMGDALRTELALHIWRTHRPRLMLLHLTDLDSAQHSNGPGSPGALSTLATLDGYVRQVRDAVAESPDASRTYIVVVSDHGFAPTSEQLQPNAVFARAGLIDVDANGRVTGWRAWFHSEGGAGFVFLRDPSDVALLARVRTLVDGLAADPANGIASVWSRADLDRLGADPRPSLGIGMRSGFYSAMGLDATRVATRSRGGHGFDPQLPELRASLILTGPGLGGRGTLGTVRMTQVAPTVARLLGLTLDTKADAPLPLPWPTARE